MEKFGLIFSVAVLIFLGSCNKAELNVDPYSNSEVLKATDSYLIAYNEFGKAVIMGIRGRATPRHLLALHSSLSQKTSFPGFQSFFSKRLNIPEYQLFELEEKRKALLSVLPKTETSNRKFLQTRFEKLVEDGVLDVSYFSIIFSGVRNHSNGRHPEPCWKVALVGIGGGAVSAAFGGPGGMILGGLALFSAVHTMATGGCY